MKKLIWLLVIVAVVCGVWLLMSKSDDEFGPMEQEIAEHAPEGTTGADDDMHQSTEDDMTPPGTTAFAGAALSTGSAKEFTITGSNFAFAPEKVTVKKGDTVKITFVNSGGKHDLRIDEFNAKTNVIDGGAQETITFVADKVGSFEYYCSVGSNRTMGMKGMLTVTE